MSEIDERLDKLRPLSEREQEAFKLGVEYGVELILKKVNKRIVKSSWFEIGYEES